MNARKDILYYFEEHTRSRPHQTALQTKQSSLTYQELNQQANQLARLLLKQYAQEHGRSFVAETPIALLLTRSTEAIVAMLAVLKMGGTYVPLDTKHPYPRIEGILQEIKPTFVLVQLHYPHRTSIPFNVVNVGSSDDYSAYESTNLNIPLRAEHLAYIIYTSGSTGKPKGVMAEQHSILRLVIENPHFKVEANDRVAHIGNIAFDMTTIEIYSALLNGATLIIAEQELHDSYIIFEQYLLSNAVNVLCITPTLLNYYVSENNHLFKDLKYLMVGGEPLSPEKMALIANYPTAKPQHLFSMYGPTESTGFCVCYEISTPIASDCQSIPIGSFIPGAFGYVLDADGQVCLANQEGELYIGGEGLARGYFAAPALTEKQFILYPPTGERLYRTGDIVIKNTGGDLVFLCRADRQVKLRGYRIELQEIEAVLNHHHSISQSTVCVQTDIMGQDHLVAFCVLKSNNSLDDAQSILEDVKRYVAQALPHYMLPSHHQIIDKMPFNLNGKIDYQQLEKIYTVNPLVSGQQKCIDSIHYRVLIAWESVLGQCNLQPDSNFFDLGGNSISGLQLLSHLNKTFDTHFIPAWLVDHQTITEQAQDIRQHHSGSFRQIVTFSKKGDTPALYMVHPGLLGVECYAELARHLDRRIPLLGIDSYNLYNDPIKSTIEELADIYTEAILEQHSSKQLYLGGWSLGGVIAYEMCHRLQKSGVEVIKLFLIEPAQVFQSSLPPDESEERSAELIKHTPDYIMAYLATLPEGMAKKTIDCFSHDALMTHRFHPTQRVKSKGLIFDAEQWDNIDLFGEKITHEHWKDYFSELEMIPLPGNHLSIMEGECLMEIARRISHDILLGNKSTRSELILETI
jgi:amino acid adenylation domain-containing protein